MFKRVIYYIVFYYVLFICDIDPPSMSPLHSILRQWKALSWTQYEYTRCFHAKLLVAFVTDPWVKLPCSRLPPAEVVQALPASVAQANFL